MQSWLENRKREIEGELVYLNNETLLIENATLVNERNMLLSRLMEIDLVIEHYSPIISYICDGKACKDPKSCQVECFHTTDIRHAKSFLSYTMNGSPIKYVEAKADENPN